MNIFFERDMRRTILMAVGLTGLTVLASAVSLAPAAPAPASYRISDLKAQLFFSDRGTFSDDLLKRVVDVSIEDLWDYLRDKGFNCQFDTGFQMLHPDKPFAGRAMTAQYMPLRRDMFDAIAAEGKREGSLGAPFRHPLSRAARSG